MSRPLIRILQVLLPVVALGGAGLAAYFMYLNRPLVETQPPVFEPPGVRVQLVTFETVSLTVTSQGTVQPRTSSQLVPEISGLVTEVASSFAVGGFFEAGDVLLTIDPYDYQQAVIAARSQLAQAQLRLAQEEAEAEVARREWAELGRGDPTALTLRQPQVGDARAAVAAAEAALDRANRDLERAEIKAPYAGRVQSKDVDVGQFVTKGTAVARIYAVDSAEIRLPLPDEELAYVDVPLSYRGGEQETGPRVTLSARFAGQEHTWQGRIVRTESEIDPVSRMVHVVAEVLDPYAPSTDQSRPPLAAGMFVEAELEGRTARDVVVLPWAALRGRDQVLVVDESSRLQFRQVEILRSTSDEVLVSGGLAEGERVCVSALDTVTDGMAVRVLDDDVRMARATPDAAPAGPRADDSATITDRVSETAAPATADFDIDPTLSREEQIAAIRRQVTLLASAPAVEQTPAAAVTATPTGPRVADADFDIDPTLSRDEQIAAIRRQVALVAIAPAVGQTPAAADTATPTAPRVADADFDDDPTLSREEQIAAIRRQVALLTSAPAVEQTPAAADTATPTAPRVADAAPAGPAGPGAANTRDGARARAGLGGRGGGRGRGGPGRGRGGRGGPERGRGGRSGLAVGGAPPPRAEPESAAPTAPAVEPDTATRADPAVEPDTPAAPADPAVEPDTAAAPVDPTVEPDPAPAPPGPVIAPAPRPGGAPARPSIAVAPFSNVSRNPADDWIGGDLTAALRTAIDETDAVGIVALGDADASTALETAEAGNARWLVGGGYQRIGDRLRLTARVLEVAGGDLVGTVKLDGTVDELETLTRDMVAAVRVELAGDAATSRPAADRSPTRPADPRPRLAVAVVPLANITRNPADDRLGREMAQAMADGLRQLDGVSVVPLDERDETTALDAATGRSAAWLVSGGYQHVGGRLRITARLLDAATGELVQTVKVDGTIDELADLLAEVVSTLRAALVARTANVVAERTLA